MSQGQKLYRHEGSDCTFLGQYEDPDTKKKYDLYFHKPANASFPTIIARHGDGDGDYTSGLNAPINTVMTGVGRARQLGLLES